MDSSSDHGFPVVHLSSDGWSTEDEATATCFCGAVQIVFVSLCVLRLSQTFAFFTFLLYSILTWDTRANEQ